MKIKLDEGAYMPVRAHETDAGLDIRTPHGFTIYAHGSYIVDTGVHVQLPEGTAGMLKSKSGLNINKNIQSEGVIDAGFTGSIVCKLYNRGDRDVFFQAGDKITQLVIMPVVIPKTLEVVESLDETERGDKGFGSSGE